MIRIAEEEKRELEKYVEAIENIVKEQEEVKEYTVDGLVSLLIKAFCDEVTAYYQYFTAMHLARGEGRKDAIEEYKEHLDDELEHLEKIALRLEQLGGKPVSDLDEISSLGSSWTRVVFTEVEDQLKLLIDAEYNARQFYQKVISYARGLQDWVTVKLFKQLLEDETNHEFDLKRLLEEI